jgi:hypothetical protein
MARVWMIIPPGLRQLTLAYRVGMGLLPESVLRFELNVRGHSRLTRVRRLWRQFLLVRQAFRPEGIFVSIRVPKIAYRLEVWLDVH